MLGKIGNETAYIDRLRYFLAFYDIEVTVQNCARKKTRSCNLAMNLACGGPSK
jgi:hypothetical protein